MKKTETGNLRILLTLAAMLTAAGHARADLIVNGGFEDPGSGGARQPPGWTFTKGYAGDGTSFTTGINAFSGSYAYIFNDVTGGVDYSTGMLEQSDEISQQVATIPGEEYTLTFDAEELQYTGIQGFWFVWNGSTNGPAWVSSDAGHYDQFTFALIGGPGSTTTLGFEGFSTQGAFFLDNVDLEPAAAAPEPAYFGIAGAMLGCMVLWKRGRTQSRV